VTTHLKNRFENFKTLNWGEVFTILAVIISVGAWSLTRIDRQFDHIDLQFKRIDNALERIERDNRDFHGRLSHLEGKVKTIKQKDIK